MQPFQSRIDDDDSDPGRYRVSVSFHEGDTPERLGESAEVIVYIERSGRRLPDAALEISAEALTKVRAFLRRVLDE